MIVKDQKRRSKNEEKERKRKSAEKNLERNETIERLLAPNADMWRARTEITKARFQINQDKN